MLPGRKSNPVIVAVIDEGVDISHEDLRGHIWTNSKEIPGNNIDDDRDGYVDDVHGWNFLGGKDGWNIYAANSEADREYARLLPQAATLDRSQRVYFEKVKKQHIQDSVARKRDAYGLLKARITELSKQDSIARKALGLPDLHYKDVLAWHPDDSLLAATQKGLLAFYKIANERGKAMSLDSFVILANTRLAALKKTRHC